MPIWMQYSAPTGNIPNVEKSQVFGLTHGLKPITPGNVGAWIQGIQLPRDIATGQASGKRQHEPIKIIKEWGPTSPQVYGYLTNNKVFPKLHLNFDQPGADGKPSPYFTITLTDAALAGYVRKPSPPHHHPKHGSEFVEVNLTFNTIAITFHSGKKSNFNDWVP